MMRIVRVGAPQSMEIAGMWLIHAFGIRVIAGLQDEGALGAHILAIRVESMSFLPGFAIATAARGARRAIPRRGIAGDGGEGGAPVLEIRRAPDVRDGRLLRVRARPC